MSADSDYEFAQTAAESDDPVEYFANFLVQIGVEDSASVLAQLATELSNEEILMLASDPSIYMGLSQLNDDYMEEQNDLAQTLAEDFEDEFAF